MEKGKYNILNFKLYYIIQGVIMNRRVEELLQSNITNITNEENNYGDSCYHDEYHDQYADTYRDTYVDDRYDDEPGGQDY